MGEGSRGLTHDGLECGGDGDLTAPGSGQRKCSVPFLVSKEVTNVVTISWTFFRHGTVLGVFLIERKGFYILGQGILTHCVKSDSVKKLKVNLGLAGRCGLVVECHPGTRSRLDSLVSCLIPVRGRAGGSQWIILSQRCFYLFPSRFLWKTKKNKNVSPKVYEDLWRVPVPGEMSLPHLCTQI